MDQAYGAGYLEGALTADLIYSHWYNTVRGYCTDRPDICKNLTDFLTTNTNWIKSQSQNDPDAYWYQVRAPTEEYNYSRRCRCNNL